MAPIWGNDAGYDPATELDKIIALSTPLSAEVTKNGKIISPLNRKMIATAISDSFNL